MESSYKHHSCIHEPLIGILKHRLKHASANRRKLVYTTVIRPQNEYAFAIWDPDKAYLVDQIESLQNGTARFIFSNYSRHNSVTTFKLRPSLPILSHRRKLPRLSLFRKLCRHCPLHAGFISSAPTIFPRTDYVLKVTCVKCHASRYSQSFIPHKIVYWNALPFHMVTVTYPTKFQELLRTFFVCVLD